MVIHIEIGMDGCYNLRNPAVKRLMKEAEELRNSTEEYYAQPVEGNLFEWHFTVRGPSNTDFDGGVYHGRITLPPEYPMKPPSIILLTPNGRFEVNKKICLSISGHHPESWRPSWSIRTALLAIIGFMPTHGNGAIGSLDYSPEERQTLAKRSLNWECPECGIIESLLEKRTSGSSSSEASNEALQLMSMISLKGEEEKEVKRDSSISKGLETDSPLPIDFSSEESVKSSDDNKIGIQKVIIKPTENHNLVPGPSTLETVTRQRLPFSQMSLENSSYTVPQVEHFEEVENIQATSGVLSSRTWSTPLMCVLAFLIALLLLRRLFFLY